MSLSHHPRLPPELSDRVIDYLEDDTAALSTCSLLSRQWLPRTRRYLYRAVTISDIAQFTHFKQAISKTDNPISATVTHLTIAQASKEENSLFSQEWPHLLEHLPKAEQLTVSSWNAAELDADIRQILHTYFHNIAKLRMVDVTITSADLLWLLRACPKLSAISLEFVGKDGIVIPQLPLAVTQGEMRSYNHATPVNTLTLLSTSSAIAASLPWDSFNMHLYRLQLGGSAQHALPSQAEELLRTSASSLGELVLSIFNESDDVEYGLLATWRRLNAGNVHFEHLRTLHLKNAWLENLKYDARGVRISLKWMERFVALVCDSGQFASLQTLVFTIRAADLWNDQVSLPWAALISTLVDLILVRPDISVTFNICDNISTIHKWSTSVVGPILRRLRVIRSLGCKITINCGHKWNADREFGGCLVGEYQMYNFGFD